MIPFFQSFILKFQVIGYITPLSIYNAPAISYCNSQQVNMPSSENIYNTDSPPKNRFARKHIFPIANNNSLENKKGAPSIEERTRKMRTSIVATQFSTNQDTLLHTSSGIAFLPNPLLTCEKGYRHKTL